MCPACYLSTALTVVFAASLGSLATTTGAAAYQRRRTSRPAPASEFTERQEALPEEKQ